MEKPTPRFETKAFSDILAALIDIDNVTADEALEKLRQVWDRFDKTNEIYYAHHKISRPEFIKNVDDMAEATNTWAPTVDPLESPTAFLGLIYTYLKLKELQQMNDRISRDTIKSIFAILCQRIRSFAEGFSKIATTLASSGRSFCNDLVGKIRRACDRSYLNQHSNLQMSLMLVLLRLSLDPNNIEGIWAPFCSHYGKKLLSEGRHLLEPFQPCWAFFARSLNATTNKAAAPAPSLVKIISTLSKTLVVVDRGINSYFWSSPSPRATTELFPILHHFIDDCKSCFSMKLCTDIAVDISHLHERFQRTEARHQFIGFANEFALRLGDFCCHPEEIPGSSFSKQLLVLMTTFLMRQVASESQSFKHFLAFPKEILNLRDFLLEQHANEMTSFANADVLSEFPSTVNMSQAILNCIIRNNQTRLQDFSRLLEKFAAQFQRGQLEVVSELLQRPTNDSIANVLTFSLDCPNFCARVFDPAVHFDNLLALLKTVRIANGLISLNSTAFHQIREKELRVVRGYGKELPALYISSMQILSLLYENVLEHDIKQGPVGKVLAMLRAVNKALGDGYQSPICILSSLIILNTLRKVDLELSKITPETVEELQHYLLIINLVKRLPQLEDPSAQTKASGLTLSIIARVERNFTQSMDDMRPLELNFVCQHYDSVRQAIASTQPQEDYNVALARLNSLKDKVLGLSRVAKWLKDKQYPLAPVIVVSDAATVNELNATIATTNFGFSSAPEKQAVLRFIEFFVTKKSILFNVMAGDEPLKTEEAVSAVVDRTKDFLQRLLDLDKLKLSDFSKLHNLQERAGQNYHDELLIVADYFAAASTVSDSAKAEQQKLAIKYALEVLTYYSLIDGALECWKTYGIFQAESKRLQDPNLIPPRDTDPSLAQAKMILTNIEATFGKKWNVNFLRAFAALTPALDFIRFVSEYPNFNQTLAIVTRNMQGQDSIQSLLTTVSVVQRTLGKFISAWQARNSENQVTLADVCSNFSDSFCKETDDTSAKLQKIAAAVTHMEKQIEVVVSKLSTIRVVFASASQASMAAVSANLPLYIAKGRFCCDVNFEDVHATSEVSFLIEKVNIKSAILSEFVVKLRVFQSSTPEAAAFLQCYDKAKEYHGILLELRDLGLPDVPEADKVLPMPLRPEDYVAAVEQMQEYKAKWSLFVQNVRKSSQAVEKPQGSKQLRELQFLNNRQLAAMIRQSKSCTTILIQNAKVIQTARQILSTAKARSERLPAPFSTALDPTVCLQVDKVDLTSAVASIGALLLVVDIATQAQNPQEVEASPAFKDAVATPHLATLQVAHLKATLNLYSRLLEIHLRRATDSLRPLLGYIWQCFPELAGKILKDVADQPAGGVLEECLDHVLTTSAASDQDFYSPVVLSLIERFSNKFTLDDDDDEEDGPRSRPKLYRHFDNPKLGSSTLTRLMFDINDSFPHPSQVLWCSSDSLEGGSAGSRGLVTARDVANFVERVRTFSACSAMHFFIVSPNLLPSRIRSKLRDLLAQCEAENKPPAMRLHLIFTGATGIDTFDFLDTPSSVSVPETPQNKVGAVGMAAQTIEVVVGPAGSGKSSYIQRCLAKETLDICEVISCNESFTVKSFIERCIKWHENFTSLTPAVGLHFKVSGYCALGELNRMILDMFTFGLITDAASGMSFRLSPHIKWFVFFELEPAAAGDQPYSRLGTWSGLLAAVPAIAMFATRKELADSVEDVVFKESWLVALAFYTKFAGVPGGAAIPDSSADPAQLLALSTIMPIDIETGKRVLSGLLEWSQKNHRQIALLKRKSNIACFLDALAARVDWLRRYASWIVQFEVAASVPIREHCANFLVEALRFAAPNLDLVALSHEYLRIYTGKDAIANISTGVFGVETFRPAESTEQLAPLAAAALQLSNSADVNVATKQCNFILTHDIVAKLASVHSRRAMGRNMIMCGGTGVGKTETFEFYAAASNVETILLMHFELANFILRKVLKYDSVKKALALSAEWPVHRFQPAVGLLIDVIRRENKVDPVDGIVSAVKQICEIVSASQDGQPGKPFFQEVALPLVRFLKTSLSIFPFLIRSKLLKELETWNDPADEGASARVLDLVPDTSALCNLLSAFVGGKFETLFKRILMDKNITQDQFSASVREARDLALKAAQKFNEAKIRIETETLDTIFVGQMNHLPIAVLFVDEFNTTSLMGVVKEVVCDHSLGGVALPSNLFIIAAMNPASSYDNYTTIFSTDFTGTTAVRQEYQVRDSPESLKNLIVEFGEFRRLQQEQFLAALSRSGVPFTLSPPPKDDADHDQRLVLRESVFRKMLTVGQNFLRASHLQNVRVSIRDTVRARTYYEHLFATEVGRKLLFLPPLREDTSQMREEFTFWSALSVAVMSTYFYRLPCPSRVESLTLSVVESNEIATVAEMRAATTSLLQKLRQIPDAQDRHLTAADSASLMRIVFGSLIAGLDASLGDPISLLIDALQASKIDESILDLVKEDLLWGESNKLAPFDVLLKFLVLLGLKGRWLGTVLTACCKNQRFKCLFDPTTILHYEQLLDVGSTINEILALATTIEPPQLNMRNDLLRCFCQVADHFYLKTPTVNHFGLDREQVDILAVLKRCQRDLFAAAELPDGIASTDALLANFYATVLSVNAKVPLAIFGPAGCGKTLSYVLATDNMKGSSTTNALFKHLRSAIADYRYQCSKLSTDAQIRSVFMNAIERQESLEQAMSDCRDICLVLLDEAGLPQDPTNPLKAIHYFLDHPKISTIILTNTILDAAKMNRAALLQLPPTPPRSDLLTLAQASLFGKKSQLTSGTEQCEFVVALCEAFGSCNQFTENFKSGMFQQRDFIYFLRSLRKLCLEPTKQDLVFTVDALLRCVHRNFGGLPFQAFCRLMDHFYEAVRNRLHSAAVRPGVLCSEFCSDNAKARVQAYLSSDQTVHTLAESISTGLSENEDPRLSSFRYICLIDPTSTETAIALLHRVLGPEKAKKLRVLTLSDFSGDQGDENFLPLMKQFQSSMANGETVILVNCERVWTNFYDVFNRYFDRMTGEAEGEEEYYANLAVGTVTEACRVDPRFKVIVHVPLSRLPECPIPFLDRFEKYTLSVSQILEDALQNLLIGQQYRNISKKKLGGTDGPLTTVLHLLRDGVNDAVSRLHTMATQSQLFSNLDPNQTIDSLMLRIVEDTIAARSWKEPIVGERFNVNSNNADEFTLIGTGSSLIHDGEVDEFARSKLSSEDPIEDEKIFVEDNEIPADNHHDKPTEDILSTQLSRAIRAANFELLQLARPEYFLRCKIVPASYAVEYILNQEHFSISRFLCGVSRRMRAGESLPSRKICIYSRGAGQLLSLEQSSPVAQALRAQLGKDISLQSICLSGVTLTAEACEAFVSTATASTEPTVILASADTLVASASQINWFRSAIDRNIVEQRDNILVVLVLHLPAETSLSSRPLYAPIYLNSWRYLYIDSLGLSEVDSAAVSVDYDARTWVAWAYGIKSARLTPAVAMSAMEGIFFEVLEQVMSNCLFTMDKDVAQDLKYARHCYYPYPSFNSIRAILRANPQLFSKIVARYAQSWAGNLIHSVMLRASDALAQGRSLSSFVKLLQQSMRSLMTPLVTQTLVQLMQSFALDPTLRWISKSESGNPDAPAFRRLISLVLDSIYMPTLDSSTQDFSVFEDAIDASLKIGGTQAFELPFFHAIWQKIRDAHHQVLARGSKTSILALELARFIESSNPALHKILQHINSHSCLYDAFSRDLVLIDFSKYREPELRSFTEAVISRLVPEKTVIDLFLAPLLNREHLSLLRSCWSSISQLGSAKPIAMNVLKSRISHIGDSSVKYLRQFVSSATVEALFAVMEDAFKLSQAEDSEAAAAKLLRKCLSGIRSFRSSLSSVLQEMIAMNPFVQYQFLGLLCTHIVAAAAPATSASLLRCIIDCATHFSGIGASLGDEKKAIDSASLLCSLVRLTVSLCDSYNKHEPQRPVPVQEAVRDLIGVFIDDSSNQSPTTADAALSGNLPPLVVSVLEAIFDVLVLPTSLLSEYLPSNWCAAKLSRWIAQSPQPWVSVALQLAGERISQAFAAQHGRDAEYKFDPCLLPINLDQELTDRINRFTTSPAAAALPSCCQLEQVLYSIFSKGHESNLAENLASLCAEYERLKPPHNISASERVIQTIRQSATADAILRAAASALSNESKTAETIIADWDSSQVTSAVPVLRSILGTSPNGRAYSPNGALFQAQPYFLQFLSTNACLAFLKDEKALVKLGMEKWRSPNTQAAANMYAFPFTVDSSDEMGAAYEALRRAVSTENKAQFDGIAAAAAADERLKYRLRMFLILVCYYEYFNECKRCAFVELQLDDPNSALRKSILAGLGDRELSAYKFLAKGPLPRNGGDISLDLPARFSAQARDPAQATDISLCNLMVNCLAVAMGCPSETTHLFSRIFSLASARTTSCPGSASARNNYDCGFVTDITGKMAAGEPQIMGENLQYRHALNSISWACWAWSLFLPANVNEVNAAISSWTSPDHFINYYRDESVELGYNNRPVDVMVRIYMVMRAHVFFAHFCDHPDTKAKHIHPLHFVTESLHSLWNKVWPAQGSSRDVRLTNPRNAAQAIAVEAVFKEIFDNVSSNYMQLRDKYLAAAKSSPSFAVVCDLQAFAANKHRSFIVPFDIAKKKLSDSEQHKLLTQWFQDLPRFSLLKRVSLFVRFYGLLNKLFQYRITMDQARTLSVPKCLDLIRPMEPESTITHFEAVYRDVKTEWAALREEMGGVVGGVCPVAAREGRQFEGDMIFINDDTPLSELITQPASEMSGDALMRTVNAISMQSKLLLLRDQTITKEDNPGNVLFSPVSEKEFEVDLIALDSHSDSLWLTFPWSEVDWNEFVQAEAILPAGWSSQNGCYVAEINFNWSRILRQIVMLTDGKPIIRSTDWKDRHFVPADPNFLVSLKSAQQQQNDADIEEQPGSLTRLACRIIAGSKIAKDMPEHLKQQLNLILKNEDEEGLQQMKDWLATLVRFLSSRDPVSKELRVASFSGEETLQAVSSQIRRSKASPSCSTRLHHFQLKYLRAICFGAIEKYESKSYLFAKDVPDDFQQPLTSEIATKLEKLKSDVLLAPEPSKQVWLSVCSALLDEFSKASTFNQLDRFASQPLMKLGRVIADATNMLMSQHASLKSEDILRDYISKLIPETLSVDNFAPFMRFLYVLKGLLQAEQPQTAPSSDKRDSKTDLWYKEKVPAVLEEVPLFDSSPVEAPTDSSPSSGNPEAASATPATDFVSQQHIDITSAVAQSVALGAGQRGSSPLSDALESEKVSERDCPRGLLNYSSNGLVLRNRCFANSMIQCLLSLPQVRHLIRQSDSFPELKNLCNKLWIAYEEDRESTVEIDVEQLMAVLAKFFPQYRRFLPQSAEEFLLRLIDLACFPTPLKKYLHVGKWRIVRSCIPHDGAHQSVTEQDCTWIVTVPFSNTFKVFTVDSLVGYILSGNKTDKFTFNEEDQSSISDQEDCETRYEVADAPVVLRLLVHRCTDEYGNDSQSEMHISDEVILPWAASPFRYRLCSVVHYKAGHYWAELRIGDRWILVNDANVREMRPEERINAGQTAYMLFYEQITAQEATSSTTEVSQSGVAEPASSSSSDESESASRNDTVIEVLFATKEDSETSLIASLPIDPKASLTQVRSKLIAESLEEETKSLRFCIGKAAVSLDRESSTLAESAIVDIDSDHYIYLSTPKFEIVIDFISHEGDAAPLKIPVLSDPTALPLSTVRKDFKCFLPERFSFLIFKSGAVIKGEQLEAKMTVAKIAAEGTTRIKIRKD